MTEEAALDSTRRQRGLDRCRDALPAWAGLDDEAFETTPPRGFSSFTMAVRCNEPGVEPAAAFYRELEGKENAILASSAERHVYETLATEGIAAQLHAYQPEYRVETFYDGRSMTRHDLKEPQILRGIAEQLARLHALQPTLPDVGFFEALPRRWGPLVQRVLREERALLPPNEQEMCEELEDLLAGETTARVRALLPDAPLSFCHNDTYHGNVMLRGDGSVRLLDFEFACLNHIAFDFSNLFAETVMRHGLPEPPHFAIAEPEYTREDIEVLVNRYAEVAGLHAGRADELVDSTLRLIPLSDYMYAMAAVPLATNPIQQIRFVPYALQRFRRFLAST